MIKIEHTYKHKILLPQHHDFDREISVLVTDAELVLVECKPEEAILSKYWTDQGVEHTLLTSSIAPELLTLCKHFKPILISRTEKPEEGQYTINPDGFIDVFGYDYRACYTREQIDNCRKILALPEHFSQQSLQDIVEGKLKEGKCLVECNAGYVNPEWNPATIKLNPHITIYPVEEKMISIDLLRKAWGAGYCSALNNAKNIKGLTFSEWFDQHVK
jgi:hypothetical protein